MTFEVAQPVWQASRSKQEWNALYLEQFRQRLGSQGIRLLETEWKGTHAKYSVICSRGHTGAPTPHNLKAGQGGCLKCGIQKVSELKMLRTEQAYCDLLTEIRAVPMWDVWQGVMMPHIVICEFGHIVNPRPNNVFNGQGICKVCANLDPDTSEAKCKEMLASIDAKPMWDTWQGVNVKHHVICKNGHHCMVRPNVVIRGGGICGFCYATWDIFYLVANHEWIKLGITSGNVGQRLRNHRTNGYTQVLFIASNLDARELETQLLKFLKSSGLKPVRGNEYFSIDALPVILSELDAYGLNNEVTA